MATSALVGSVLSKWMEHETLLAIFAVLAALAAALMLLPKDDQEEVEVAGSCTFNIPLAVLIAVVVGLLGGMVGQGGSFILIPMMLHLLKLPTRVVIGSNLALVFLASVSGFAGKLGTGQIPLVPAAAVVVGAVVGVQIGSALSQKTKPAWLRRVLAVIVALAAIGIGADACGIS